MHSLDGSRIESGNFKKYLESQNILCHISQSHKLPMEPLLQIHFGDKYDNDCTLTSLTEVWHYLMENKLNPYEIYEVVREFAEKRKFFTKHFGTIPLFINDIGNHLSLTKVCKSRYFKGIGFNFDKIKRILDAGMPVILNFTDDGRNYYKKHSVTVIGYEIISDEMTGTQHPFLLIHDNWKATVSYLDYNRMSRLSSISYFQNRY